jgi:DUF1680 family protein
LYTYADTATSKIVITLNGKEIPYNTYLGYAAITRRWESGDSINISLPMSVRRVIAHKRIKDDENLTALEYGPIVYCFEGIDNNNQLDKLTLPRDALLKVDKRNDVLQGVNVISGDIPINDGLTTRKITAIPYYAWSNRGAGTMKVWLPRN